MVGRDTNENGPQGSVIRAMMRKGQEKNWDDKGEDGYWESNHKEVTCKQGFAEAFAM